MSPRSVLFLVPDLIDSPGGIARHGRIVCQALADRDTAISILALHDSSRSIADDLGTFGSLRYHGCNGRRSLFVFRALGSLLRRPHLILVEHPNFSFLGWFCARLSMAHFVVFTHGLDIWFPLRAVRRWAIRRADRIVCVSAFTAEQAVRSNGLSRRKVRVIYNCLDPRFETASKPLTSTPDPSLLTVGRIAASDHYKGHEQVIRSLPTLLVKFPTLTYDIVGDGDGRAGLELLAAEQGVAHTVHFHGTVSEEALASFYAETSVYVMPSSGEGFGLAFAEAMAHGKPAIAGNADASMEVVRDGETGIVVDPTDIPGLIRAIETLLSDDILRREMGRRGAEVVNRDFHFSAFKIKLLDLFRELTPAADAPYLEGQGEHTRL